MAMAANILKKSQNKHFQTFTNVLTHINDTLGTAVGTNIYNSYCHGQTKQVQKTRFQTFANLQTHTVSTAHSLHIGKENMFDGHGHQHTKTIPENNIIQTFIYTPVDTYERRTFKTAVRK